MSRLLRAFILLMVLASCGSREFSAPRNLDNACAILSERPNYARALRATERRWGVPVAVQMATIYQESKFIGNARTPFQYTLGVIPMGRQSSAYGYSQALDGTWREYQVDQRRMGARRDRIDDATDFMGWYMNRSRERNGISLSDARNQYLAYHEGHTGFARGSYNQKSWLMRIAGTVQDRAVMYDAQLLSCPNRLR
ncbi:MAG: lytic transglycosylase [Rhodobacterales bacterium]|nr:lytic transglycosylase [Rhodobacterales bacterium]MDX5389884.1 lytic transglycosylase [Rhodobacterales bacterium]MDX5489575.1 lytic transglycosylase [Rhodobacterales bacterium]